jgi:hypothetical protein
MVTKTPLKGACNGNHERVDAQFDALGWSTTETINRPYKYNGKAVQARAFEFQLAPDADGNTIIPLGVEIGKVLFKLINVQHGSVQAFCGDFTGASERGAIKAETAICLEISGNTAVVNTVGFGNDECVLLLEWAVTE